MDQWQQLYQALGIQDFIYFITSPSLQDTLFPVKIIFILFTVFFFCAVVYFYLNSSYLKYQFLQDTNEFLTWDTYGLAHVGRRWRKIMQKTESGSVNEYKLAIIEADDLLYQVLEDKGFKGEGFEELLENANKKKIENYGQLLEAHQIRNSIVYDPDYTLDLAETKRLLAIYESGIKSVSIA